MSLIQPYLANGRQSDQSVLDVAVIPPGALSLHRVGTRGVLMDGRVFHYARNSSASALVAGKLCQSPDMNSEWEDCAVGTEVVGATTLTVTSGSDTALASEFVGGYALTNSGTTGAGQTFPIASHAAWGGTTALAITLDCANPVLFNADTTVTIVPSPWADVIISGGNQDHFACGVPNVAVPAGNAINQYFWMQTWGICATWHDANTANGAALASGTTAGQVEINGGTDQTIGINMSTAVGSDYGPVFLTIAP